MLPQLFRVAPVYTDVLSVTALRNVRGAHVLVLSSSGRHAPPNAVTQVGITVLFVNTCHGVCQALILPSEAITRR